jgi:hypothetical protein
LVGLNALLSLCESSYCLGCCGRGGCWGGGRETGEGGCLG